MVVQSGDAEAEQGQGPSDGEEGSDPMASGGVWRGRPALPGCSSPGDPFLSTPLRGWPSLTSSGARHPLFSPDASGYCLV